MKLDSLALAVLLSFIMLSCLSAKPMHEGIDYDRYLEVADDIEKELNEWLAKYGDEGHANGWIPANGSRSSDAIIEDHKQRFFLTRQLLLKLEKEHPEAQFSTDSPFTLLTEAEFAAYARNSYIGSDDAPLRGSVRTADDIFDDVPDDSSGMGRRQQNRDWSTSACNAPVQNQGNCGSCWAFATVGAVETAQCLAGGGSVVKYSEQQVTSCDRSNNGCGGGVPVYAFRYIQQNGLCRGTTYPYTSGSGRASQCTNECERQSVPIRQITRLSANEASLIKAINQQPVVVAVAAGNAVWKQYRGGVVSSCPTTQLDHAVIAIGYDGDTIKIKNSWGSRWGENGYIRLRRGVGGRGACNMLADMSFPHM